MTRTLTGSLATHVAGSGTTLATCWRVERQDGRVFTFTDCDRDLLVSGDLYLARAGYTRSAVASAANGSVDNLDLQGVLNDESITENDLRRGLWDYAKIEVFLVNWQAPNDGRAQLRTGWIGEVQMNDTGYFRVELRGMAQALTQTVGQVFSPECRAQLGDARCRVDLTGHRDTGVIGTAVGDAVFEAALPAAEGSYDDGVITFTSGQNDGVRREVLSWNGTRLTMFQRPPYQMASGDSFTIYHGCPKTLTACHNKFNNVANFRGEPYVPGADTLLFTGRSPSSGGGKK